MSKTRNFEELSARIRGIKQASDSEAVKGIKDPAEKGTVTPPNHPDGDSNDKKSLPEQTTVNTSREGQDMTDKDTKPSGTGKNVPPVEENGNAKEDAATAPDTPLSKIAQAIASIQKLKAQPKGATAKEAGKATAQPKAAGQKDQALQDMDLGAVAMHVKLASAILQTEEGVAMAETLLRKQAGAQAAAELIKAAGEQEWQWAQAAAQEEELQKQAAQAQAQWEEFTKTASKEEVEQVVKMAKIHERAQSKLEHDFEKQAYDMGAQDAAAMEEAMMAEGGEPIPEEGEISDEEILMLLDEAVQSGEIDEETALALAEEILGGEAGGEELPPEVMEAEKMASAILAD
jgi:hypothetical protein